MADEERVLASVADTHAFAQEITASLNGGELLLLHGELGAGKTTFVQGLAKSLGISEPITSPTFTIVSEYEVAGHPHIKRLIHIDLYRLEEGQADSEPAVQEALVQASNNEHLTVIEWADRLTKFSYNNALTLTFTVGDSETQRVVTISGHG